MPAVWLSGIRTQKIRCRGMEIIARRIVAEIGGRLS